MNKEEYVDNDVFVFRVSLKPEFHSSKFTIYTAPIPTDYHEDIQIEDNDKWCDMIENVIQNQYFTKEKIRQLKEELIEKIREADNPFDIDCVDWDGNYNVTKEQLFNVKW